MLTPSLNHHSAIHCVARLGNGAETPALLMLQ